MANQSLMDNVRKSRWILAQLCTSVILLLCGVSVVAVEFFRMKVLFNFHFGPIDHGDHVHEKNDKFFGNLGTGSAIVHAGVCGMIILKKTATKWVVAALLGSLVSFLISLVGAHFAVRQVGHINHHYYGCLECGCPCEWDRMSADRTLESLLATANSLAGAASLVALGFSAAQLMLGPLVFNDKPTQSNDEEAEVDKASKQRDEPTKKSAGKTDEQNTPEDEPDDGHENESNDDAGDE